MSGKEGKMQVYTLNGLVVREASLYIYPSLGESKERKKKEERKREYDSEKK